MMLIHIWSHMSLNSPIHITQLLPNLHQLIPIAVALERPQRDPTGVHMMQRRHHNHSRNKHRNWPEDPHQQRRSEVERPHPKRPVITPRNHRLLHELLGHHAVGHTNKKICMYVTPSGLHEACECG